MDIQTFIQNFKEAFGENAELPLVFWYSDEQKRRNRKDKRLLLQRYEDGKRWWYYQPEC